MSEKKDLVTQQEIEKYFRYISDDIINQQKNNF
jgi:hypothetical protein